MPSPRKPTLTAQRPELATAALLQHHLLPQRVPVVNGYEFDAYYAPAGDLGGDYYDFIDHGNGVIGMAIGDAVGKGVSAALLMVETRALVHAYGRMSDSPAEILRRVNAILHSDLQRGMFVSLYYARVSTSRGIVTVASAGHTPLLLVKKGQHRLYRINPEGTVLGATAPEAFDKKIKEEKFRIAPGDRLLLFTDGATEARDEVGNIFGLERLAEALMAGADQPSSLCLRHLIETIRAHRGSAPPSDDIALVTTRLMPEDLLLKTRNKA